MDVVRWFTLTALTMFLLEGFVLSVFPNQFKEMLAAADPRTLQILGVFETVMAIGLMAGLLFG
ncbi:MAG: hypothetical protein JNL96_00700 [Planctomycetaceae bacterium]|nr:hypothetical protein [Planctomycetaceae bacterium]